MTHHLLDARERGQVVPLTIHIEPGSQPIAGWLQQEGAAQREFVGMIELIQLLNEARARADGSPSAPRHGESFENQSRAG